jgi:spore coat polysaccharide biosynthesis protein SpsF
MIAVFLQARLDSTRLPRKALLPLADDTVIGHAMRSLRGAADLSVLLTDEDSAEELRPQANAAGFDIFVGSKEDVLKRFADAARHYGPDRIIRATGDNPLVGSECARLICRMHADEGADYSGFRGLPLGTGVECVETEALLEADKLARSLYEREHVCPYLYRHPERFVVFRPKAPQEYRFPEGRVTLDTEDDYRKLQALYDKLYRGRPVGTELLVRELSRHQPVAG